MSRPPRAGIATTHIVPVRDDIAHILLCASDLARTKRGGLSDACTETLGWDFYWPCRRVLQLLEAQLGYAVWSEWGDEPDERRPDAIIYADALLEASAIAMEHWDKVVDFISIESTEIRRLRSEVRELRALVEDSLERTGSPDFNYYTGVFA
jgi:hypothetical protein